MDVKGTDRGISAATTSLNNSGDFSLILHKNCDVPTSYLESVANTKRFLERYAGDDIFRAKCENNPQAAVIEYNINVDPIEIRELWDISFSRQSTDEHRPTVAVARFRSFCEEKIAHRDTLRTRKCEPDQPAFQSWRRRQIARMWGSFAPAKVLAIIHSPVSFELNIGCSIGCWFCGVNVAKLRSSSQYTTENVLLWNELLTKMIQLIGPSVAQGFCYWATDPLDNPDYKKFIADFHTITGRCP